jgi:hypothetical protein
MDKPNTIPLTVARESLTLNLMSARPRLYFDVDDRLRWAMRLQAADENIPSLAILARKAVEHYVQAKLSEVDRRMAHGESPRQTGSKRGRRPKPRD